MANVLDVAAHILRKQSPISAMKLQKLVYYAQAWSLVWDGKALFRNRIEAWAYGPVCPALYGAHRQRFEVRRGDIKGDPKKLTRDERDTVNAVLSHYGPKTPLWLSELTHREAPWCGAREGLAAGQPGKREITHVAMAEYYGSLWEDN